MVIRTKSVIQVNHHSLARCSPIAQELQRRIDAFETPVRLHNVRQADQLLFEQALQPAHHRIPDCRRRVEQLDGHGVVGDVVEALLGQARVAQEVGARRVFQRALQEGRGFAADNVDGKAQAIVGDALNDLDGAFGRVPVDEEVRAQFEQLGAVPGDIGNADNTEAGKLRQLQGDESGRSGCCPPLAAKENQASRTYRPRSQSTARAAPGLPPRRPQNTRVGYPAESPPS